MRIERNGRAVMINFDATQEARLAALRLANREAAALVTEAWAKALAASTEDNPVKPRTLLVTLSLAEDSISVKQRKFLHHAVLRQIAEKYVFPDGTRYTEKAWKELFRERFLGDDWYIDEDGELVHKRNSSEGLGDDGYGRFIDQIIDTAVDEYGVRFVFRPGQREATRPAQKGRTPKMAVPQHLPGLHAA